MFVPLPSLGGCLAGGRGGGRPLLHGVGRLAHVLPLVILLLLVGRVLHAARGPLAPGEGPGVESYGGEEATTVGQCHCPVPSTESSRYFVQVRIVYVHVRACVRVRARVCVWCAWGGVEGVFF